MRTGALGDFCITLPVLQALFATGRPVEVMCQARFAVLIREFGVPARVWDAGGAESMWLFAERGVEPAPYEMGVAFSEAHAAAMRALGIPDVRWVSARPPAGVTAVEHFQSVWPILNKDGADPPYADLHQGVVIAPGASAERRRWPMARWEEVAEGLKARGVDVRWVGGPLEPWASGGRATLEQATERPDLAGLLGLARGCRVWLGADSGPAHLAAWAGANVGVVARAESVAWAPDGARVFDWGVEAERVVDWAAPHALIGVSSR